MAGFVLTLNIGSQLGFINTSSTWTDQSQMILEERVLVASMPGRTLLPCSTQKQSVPLLPWWLPPIAAGGFYHLCHLQSKIPNFVIRHSITLQADELCIRRRTLWRASNCGCSCRWVCSMLLYFILTEHHAILGLDSLSLGLGDTPYLLINMFDTVLTTTSMRDQLARMYGIACCHDVTWVTCTYHWTVRVSESTLVSLEWLTGHVLMLWPRVWKSRAGQQAQIWARFLVA